MLALWLIPSEFMDVNYGTAVKRYLLEKVTLLRIHRSDPKEVQFEDALVSSAVVCFRNSPPPPAHAVEFTFGGSLTRRSVRTPFDATVLREQKKWTNLVFSPGACAGRRTLSELFTIKRGIATGANDFFVLSRKQAVELELPRKFLKPVLPSPRYMRLDEIPADEAGIAKLHDPLVLLDCPLPEDHVRTNHPSLWQYLQAGKDRGIDRGYICASLAVVLAGTAPPSPDPLHVHGP